VYFFYDLLIGSFIMVHLYQNRSFMSDKWLISTKIDLNISQNNLKQLKLIWNILALVSEEIW